MQDNPAVSILRNWNVEANSGHNDGYTMKHYQEKIQEVKDYLKSLEEDAAE